MAPIRVKKMITKETVEKIAHLARLTLTEAEKEKLSHELSQIVAYVEKIGELNLEGIRPTARAVAVQNVFREGDDVAVDAAVIGKALEMAPAKDGEFLLVPKVL